MWLQNKTDENIEKELGVTKMTISRKIEDFKQKVKSDKMLQITNNFKPLLYNIWKQHSKDIITYIFISPIVWVYKN